MSNPLNGILGSSGGGSGGSGDVVGPASSTDNAIARWDLATGKLLQDSGLIVSDVAAGAITVTSTAGTAITLKNTDPAATTGASVAGDALAITAGNAVASTDTAGAAAGGAVTITSGAAARNTSGNANGGDINLTTGAGIGTGTTGKVVLPSAAGLNWSTDTGLARSAAGVVKVTDGSTGIGSALTARVFEDSTAGSGSPNILTLDESWKVIGNAGAGATAYNTLPSAQAGLVFTFDNSSATQAIRVTAAAGDNIRVNEITTDTAGYVESGSSGSTITLVAIDSTTWEAVSIIGDWKGLVSAAAVPITHHFLTGSGTTTGGLQVGVAGSAIASMTGVGIAVASNGIVGFSSGNPTNGFNTSTLDAVLVRDAAGVIGIRNAFTSGTGALRTARVVEANTAGSGAPNVLTDTESWKVLTNEGTTAKNYHTLPTAAAGYQFTFVVQDADGMRIVANTDDTIRVIDKVTATAGYIESTTIGSTVTLVSINAVEWYATSIKGTWTDGTFTYDDTSLTTP